MEKFINSFDSILKISVSYILYTFEKARSILTNIYLRYFFLLIFSSIGLIISIKYADGLIDSYTFFPFLFLTVFILISLGKIYLSSRKSVSDPLEKEDSNSILMTEDLQEVFQYYTHKKNKTKSIESNLIVFHDNEANKYFDVLEYDKKLLIDKLYDKKNVSSDDKIFLNDDLMNLDIRTLLQELNIITGIPMNMLDKLFMRFSVKEQKYVNVKSSNINSSESQSNRFLKVNNK